MESNSYFHTTNLEEDLTGSPIDSIGISHTSILKHTEKEESASLVTVSQSIHRDESPLLPSPPSPPMESFRNDKSNIRESFRNDKSNIRESFRNDKSNIRESFRSDNSNIRESFRNDNSNIREEVSFGALRSNSYQISPLHSSQSKFASPMYQSTVKNTPDDRIQYRQSSNERDPFINTFTPVNKSQKLHSETVKENDFMNNVLDVEALINENKTLKNQLGEMGVRLKELESKFRENDNFLKLDQSTFLQILSVLKPNSKEENNSNRHWEVKGTDSCSFSSNRHCDVKRTDSPGPSHQQKSPNRLRSDEEMKTTLEGNATQKATCMENTQAVVNYNTTLPLSPESTKSNQNSSREEEKEGGGEEEKEGGGRGRGRGEGGEKKEHEQQEQQEEKVVVQEQQEEKVVVEEEQEQELKVEEKVIVEEEQEQELEVEEKDNRAVHKDTVANKLFSKPTRMFPQWSNSRFKFGLNGPSITASQLARVDELDIEDLKYCIKHTMCCFTIDLTERYDSDINRYAYFINIVSKFLKHLHKELYNGQNLKCSDHFKGKVLNANGEVDERMVLLQECLNGMLENVKRIRDKKIGKLN
ncbi:hypothetical protein KGF56_002369 [Candida oxycetoniae]|uniref:Uncharacterized protein n=1 Tax=Candida oxycetoniae TaxID=497107 RepID=A0AAI9SXK3_9ASCO|nr:uncharacterized protein KGF56_002369 [Candida oxycetoniae]KAI3404852.2 hypothetical protein KGF56_002369 [Candida oxycetoniae]